MQLPKTIRDSFREYGRRGGRERARRLAPEARSAIARRAALRRWTEARFGASSFESLQLPGGDLIDRGIDDLVSGDETIPSLLVSLAAPRLRRERIPVPDPVVEDADERLYRMLERTAGELAHARYLAYLQRISSFADACHRYLAGRSRNAE